MQTGALNMDLSMQTNGYLNLGGKRKRKVPQDWYRRKEKTNKSEIKMLKFKQRQKTDYFYVTCRDYTGKSMIEIKKDFLCKGDFDVDFHYLVRRSGFVETGRDTGAYAGHMCPYNPEATVMIVCDGVDADGLTEDQQKALEYLHDIYPDSTIVS